MNIKPILYIVCVLAVILKCWLTVRFCWELDGNNVEATVLGLINDLAQLGFGLMAVYFVGVRRVALYSLSAACTVVSIVASLGFFIQSDRVSQTLAIEKTATYQQLLSKRNRLAGMNSADIEVAFKYEYYNRITDAKNLRAAVAERENELTVVALEIDRLEQAPPEEIGSPVFAGLAAMSGWASSKIRMVVYFYLSILLEIIALVSLAFTIPKTVSRETPTEVRAPLAYLTHGGQSNRLGITGNIASPRYV
jgi:hypothetical protein|tara:strand:+ start:743 stop:1495 length:753 start_codon:yes stop_codon:yes gene_type:complete